LIKFILFISIKKFILFIEAKAIKNNGDKKGQRKKFFIYI